MGETALITTNGADHANNTSSSDSSPPPSQDDQPPIPKPPDIEPCRRQLSDTIEKSQPLPPSPTSSASPHTLDIESVAQVLRTDASNGLTSEEAADRLARDGPNAIKGATGLSLWEIFLQQVANALTVVLIAVAALSFAIDDYVEGSVVVAVIVLNIAVGYVLLYNLMPSHVLCRC